MRITTSQEDFENEWREKNKNPKLKKPRPLYEKVIAVTFFLVAMACLILAGQLLWKFIDFLLETLKELV